MRRRLNGRLTRRDVLKAGGVSALGILLAGMPRLSGGLFAGTVNTPELKKLKLGFIPLTDCAPIVIAAEKGHFRKQGLEVTLSKEASWANIRDKVSVGALDGAHMLAAMPIAATLGVGAIQQPTITAFSLDLNGNAITVSNELYARMVEADPGAMRERPISARALKKVIDQDKNSVRFNHFFCQLRHQPLSQKRSSQDQT